MFDRQAQLLGGETLKARRTGPTLRRFWNYLKQYRLVLLFTAVLVIAGLVVTVLRGRPAEPAIRLD